MMLKAGKKVALKDVMVTLKTFSLQFIFSTNKYVTGCPGIFNPNSIVTSSEYMDTGI